MNMTGKVKLPQNIWETRLECFPFFFSFQRSSIMKFKLLSLISFGTIIIINENLTQNDVQRINYLRRRNRKRFISSDRKIVISFGLKPEHIFKILSS